MGYPRKIHALIVEDERDVRQAYADWFADQRKEGRLDLAEPTIVASLDEGSRQLSSESVFQVVIADLGLPESLENLVVADGSVVGVRLLHQAAKRDAYPIPVFAVVTGRLGHVESQSELHALLAREFWCGRLLVKGSSLWRAELPQLIEAAQKYCDIGLHVRDAGNDLCPTLSPREEDLVRRCVLARNDLGVDVEWWTRAARGVSWAGTETEERTKVLMGRFILGDGRAHSRYCFFKVQSRDGARVVQTSTDTLSKKLGHVKLCGETSGGSRGLLVTESIGNSKPMSLEGWLTAERTEGEVAAKVEDVAKQLRELGEPATRTLKPIGSLLRGFYDGRLATAWQTYSRGDAASSPTPPDIFRAFQTRTDELQVVLYTAAHGDLNATNIAVAADEATAKAFVFDAGWVGADLAVRDLAYLETTSLLFFGRALDAGLVGVAKLFYEDAMTVDPLPAWDQLDPLSRNTLRLVSAIRRRAVELSTPQVYALMVLDAVMGQLFGLAVQPIGNKIVRPHEAAELAKMTATWCEKLVGEHGGQVAMNALRRVGSAQRDFPSSGDQLTV